MSTFSVTTALTNKAGFVWFPAEFSEETIEELSETLSRDGFAKCAKLYIETRGDTRTITRREDMILGLPGIVTITPLHIDLIERRVISA